MFLKTLRHKFTRHLEVAVLFFMFHQQKKKKKRVKLQCMYVSYSVEASLAALDFSSASSLASSSRRAYKRRIVYRKHQNHGRVRR